MNNTEMYKMYYHIFNSLNLYDLENEPGNNLLVQE